MKVTLTRTHLYNGKHYGPGEHDVSADMIDALKRVGDLPADFGGPEANTAPQQIPQGAVAGFFVPADMTGFDPRNVRLGTGNVPTPAPQGVTPGDPVQRASAPLGPIAPASATESQTADPAAGLPPPVVHTSEGAAVSPDDLDDAETGEGAEDDGDDDDSDETSDPSADAGAETETETAPEAEAPARRGGRVTSRPRSSAAE